MIAIKGSNGVPLLRVFEAPAIGRSCKLSVFRMPVWATKVGVVFGSSKTQWGTAKLPVDLAVFGMTGCNLLVSADAVVPVNAFGGFTSFEFPVSSDSKLLGLKFYVQVYAPDPKIGSKGATMSNAVEATIGRFH